MGGSTARCLVQLLSDNGLSGGEVGLFGASPREDAGQAREECEGGEGGEGGEGFALAMRSHPGWEVSSSWVMSVTCIASPHDGTPMVDILDKWMDGVFNSMCYGAALSSDSEQRVFDFKLDHWGVHPRQPSESFKAYSARVLAAPVIGLFWLCIRSLLTLMRTSGLQAETARPVPPRPLPPRCRRAQQLGLPGGRSAVSVIFLLYHLLQLAHRQQPPPPCRHPAPLPPLRCPPWKRQIEGRAPTVERAYRGRQGGGCGEQRNGGEGGQGMAAEPRRHDFMAPQRRHGLLLLPTCPHQGLPPLLLTRG